MKLQCWGEHAESLRQSRVDLKLINEQHARLASLGLAFILHLARRRARQPFEVANASHPRGTLSLILLLKPQTLENGWLQPLMVFSPA